ncbi:hypothetical protein [Rhodococcus sp. JS3073]|nr:hypothetical protein [Rhodococcus sp. JS3073]WAM19484.1 hypothetical protein OYT95_44325 [Rhodococcus sp. JS3073]
MPPLRGGLGAAFVGGDPDTALGSLERLAAAELLRRLPVPTLAAD